MFSEAIYLSDLHEEYLDEKYFPLVMQIPRFPRYKNKRSVDPQVKLYLDENHIEESPAWGLPVPNEEAAYKSLSKYAKDIKPMSEDKVRDMNRAWQWTERHFGVYMQNSVVRSVDEVVSTLDMSTSSGAPFNIRFPTKKELFLEVPEMSSWLEEDWERLAKDPEYTFLFTSSLKEEVRPQEKIAENKIRTFLAGAVDGTVHGNRLFADMNEKMNASHLKSSSGVGMSPYKGNWDRLYRKLNIFRKGYALDESEYDSSLRAYLMWGCALLRWKMLRPEDQTQENMQRLKTYYRNLVNSLVVTAEGVLVFKLTGNPSGSVNTINDNTLILYTLLAYAWIRLCGENPNYSEFENNTSKVLVGDDNTWTVSDWAHDFFNGRNVINEWTQIGVTTTTDSLDPRPACELDFLSAHTIFYMDQAVPVYDRTKLMTSLLYAPTVHHTPAVTLTRTAALLTVGWTDTQFRKFARELIEWLLYKYDNICAEDAEWIQAKSGILSDARLSQLFLGRTVMYAQSIQYSEVQERSKPLNKTSMAQMLLVKKSQPKRGGGAKATRKSRARRARAQQVKVVLPKTQVFGNRPRRRNGNRQGRRNGGGRDYTGQGGSRGKRGGLSRTHILEEDEYIGEVTVADAPNFNVEVYPVNIGQVKTFPWGSIIAKNYEKYQFDYLEFYYKKEVSQFATDGQVGKVIMSFDSDASDGSPTTKQAMEDQEPHCDCMPSENMTLRIPPKMMKGNMVDAHYVRPAGVPGSADIKTYDVGNFQIATQGILNNVAIGELHVRYRCRLSIPILGTTTLSAPTNNSVASFVSSASEAITSGINYSIKLANALTNGIGASNINGGFRLPVGNYLIDANFQEIVTTNMTAMNIYLRNNGVIIQTNTFVIGSAAVCTANTLAADPIFYQSNGTDVLDLQVNSTFTGTGGVTGSIRFVAI